MLRPWYWSVKLGHAPLLDQRFAAKLGDRTSTESVVNDESQASAPKARNDSQGAPKARNMTARGKREAQRNASPLVTEIEF